MLAPSATARWFLFAFRVVLALVFVSITTSPPTCTEARLSTNNIETSSAQISAQNTDNRMNVGGAETVFRLAETLRAEQREESNRSSIERYKEAARLWSEARRFQQAACALRNAGEVYQVLGQTDDALANYNEGLSLSRKGKSLVEEGRILNDLGYAHFISGNASETRRKALAAWRIATAIDDREIEAQAFSNIAEANYSFGDLVKAQDYQQRALSIWRELGNLRGQALAHVPLGYYHIYLGEPDEALHSFKEALLASQAAQDVRAETLALIGIGNLKSKIGDKQEALESYSAAKLRAQQIGDQTSQAIVLGGMGYLYYGLGDEERALDYLEQAVQRFASNNEKWGVAEVKMDLGTIHHSLGNNQEALDYLREALRLFTSSSMSRLQAQALRDLGLVHSSMGDDKSALRSYEQALSLTRIGQDQRHEGYTLNYIGQVYERKKDTARALQYYHRALPLSRIAGDPAGEALTLYNIAHVQRDRGNLLEAQRQIESATTIAESLRTKVSSHDLRAAYFSTMRQTFELYIDILMLRHLAQPLEGFDTRSFEISERARARSFLELLQEARANIREGVPPELLEREGSIREVINAKAEREIQLRARKDLKEAKKVAKEIDELTAAYNQVLDQIKQTSPRYAALTLPQPLKLKEVQQNVLDDQSILLQYALGDQRSYVWTVTRNSFSGYQLHSRKEIEDSALRLYKLITAHQMIAGESLTEFQERKDRADTALPAEASLLTKLVLGPLAGKLGNKRLIIIADGALQYIPFGALFDPDSSSQSPQWLITNHEIVNQPSASTLAAVMSEGRSRKKGPNAVAVLADPVFEMDDPRVRRSDKVTSVEPDNNLELRKALRDRDIGISADGIQIPRLFASAGEADGIVAAAPWGMVLKAIGFEATRERVLGPELADYRIIHFATHGLINNKHPELSGIVFSLYNQEGQPQDGFLRLHDIYNLRLPADLVVLSACSTGLGKDVKGEGLIGLTRGFMYAGASGVIASLWKVDDEATAVLMKHFYDGLLARNLTPAAALRSAQLTMSQDKRWQSPYYWAGFVIQGQYNQKDLAPGYFSGTQRRAAIIVAVTLVSCLAALLLVTVIRRRRV